MKKIKIIIICLFVTIIGVNNIDAKSQNLSRIVKSKYNNKTKELYVWGVNHSGNLGTGNYNNVTEAKMVKVNDLIGKQKIIEYAITDSQTYVLTDKNRVYASGFHVGDGSYGKKRNKFVELKFYKQNIYKITSLNIVENYDAFCKSTLGYDDACYTEIDFKTSNKKIKHHLYGFEWTWVGYAIFQWPDNFLMHYYNNGKISSTYPVYNDITRKNIKINAYVNLKGRLVERYTINRKARKFKNTGYSNGQIKYQFYYSGKKDILTYYKRGKKSITNIRYYKLDKKSSTGRLKLKEHKYTYKNGILKTRYTYQRINKKMVLVSKKFYYPNKKNQFKSNKNGKAKTYLTYYRNKKAYKTYRYYYNKNNKMIAKKRVKIKIRYLDFYKTSLKLK